jgi:colanic acid biosynthesis glycosyl transferase WcaI
MRRPSVLFINRVYPPVRGATGRVLRDLARSFARQGWQVTVLTAGPRKSRERDGGIHVIRLAGRQKPRGLAGNVWLWLRFLFAALRVPRTDLVVTMTDPPMLVSAGRIIKKFKKNRHIHWCHDLYPDLFPSLGVKMPALVTRLLRRSADRALHDADKIIAVGRCMARTLTHHGLEPKRVAYIPNWPDSELVKPPKPAAAAGNTTAETVDIDGLKPFEQQLKDGPKFRVLYAGNIGRAHPLATILEAASLLDEEHPEIEFAFVGDGPRFDYIARERVRRGLNNIRLLPFQPQNKLREVMESGDVHILSVEEDSAGLLVPCKMYSAFAVGRPCIYVGPHQSEMAWAIKEYKAGGVIAQGKARALADLIKKYRLSSDEWFAAHEGALAAGAVFMPRESIEAWMQRAWSVVEPDIKAEISA